MRAQYWCAAALLVCALSAMSASEEDQARKDAESVTQALEQRPCPALGDRKYLGNLTGDKQLQAAAERERAYFDGALAQLQQIVADPRLSAKQKPRLQALASWSIAASVANWSMLQVAEQSLANPLIEAGRPYPSAIVDSAQKRLQSISDNPSMEGAAAAVIRRQADAVERCSKHFDAEIFRLNQPQLQAALGSATSTGELDQLERMYRMREAAASGYGAEAQETLVARRTAIAEAERLERERAVALSAAEAAQRQAEAEKRQAEITASLGKYLVVAQRFAAASQNGNEKAALAELSRDVVMSTPQGTYRGVDSVAAAVRQQSSSGRGGSLGTPQIVGTRIVAYGRSGPYPITTGFSFDDNGRISRLDISL